MGTTFLPSDLQAGSGGEFHLFDPEVDMDLGDLTPDLTSESFWTSLPTGAPPPTTNTPLNPWQDIPSPSHPSLPPRDNAQMVPRPPHFHLTAPRSGPSQVKLESPGLSSGSSLTSDTQHSGRFLTPNGPVPSSRVHRQRSPKPARHDIFQPYLYPPRPRPPAKPKHLDPLDSADEDSRRNRDLERNRIAAGKCRQRKRERETDLEETKDDLESQNSHLQMEYSRLLDEASDIRARLMSHAACNDVNINQWIDNEAKRYVLGRSRQFDSMLAALGPTPDLFHHLHPPRCQNPCCLAQPSDYSQTPSSSHRNSIAQPIDTSTSSPLYQTTTMHSGLVAPSSQGTTPNAGVSFQTEYFQGDGDPGFHSMGMHQGSHQ